MQTGESADSEVNKMLKFSYTKVHYFCTLLENLVLIGSNWGNIFSTESTGGLSQSENFFESIFFLALHFHPVTTLSQVLGIMFSVSTISINFLKLFLTYTFQCYAVFCYLSYLRIIGVDILLPKIQDVWCLPLCWFEIFAV
jgi:hypothetical protein